MAWTKKNYKKAEIVKVARQVITPSVYQSTIFNAIIAMMNDRSKKNLIVQAVAGSGKTTTLIESLYLLLDTFGPSVNAVFLAFNKKIADELQTKVPTGFTASTLHSFGLKTLGAVRVDKWKVTNILNETLGVVDGRTLHTSEEKAYNALLREKAWNASKLIGLAKNKAILPQQIDATLIGELNAFYDLNISVTEELVTLVRETLFKSNDDLRTVDFDDMIYMPAILGRAPKSDYDLILVDESQDLNESQMLLLDNMAKANKKLRFVFVGDGNQSIYGFRGAGTDSMEIIKTRFDAEELPLSVSYRCGKAIIAHAQQIVAGILPFDGAHEGRVDTLNSFSETLKMATEERERLAILSRCNAPLVTAAYALMREGLPVVIIGRDIAEGLTKIIDRISNNKNIYMSEFAAKLSSWADTESAKYQGGKNEFKVDEIRDKEATLLAFFEGVETTNDLKAKIESIYKDTDTADGKSMADRSIKLMTIHKSKGLEFPVVAILPAKEIRTKLDWQVKQEENLLYVARTRAIERLVYIPTFTDRKG